MAGRQTRSRRPRYFLRSACSAARSASDNFTALPALSRHSLHVRQPRRCRPRLSIMIIGCLHSLQRRAPKGLSPHASVRIDNTPVCALDPRKLAAFRPDAGLLTLGEVPLLAVSR